jgi:hypothetical protein
LKPLESNKLYWSASICFIWSTEGKQKIYNIAAAACKKGCFTRSHAYNQRFSLDTSQINLSLTLNSLLKNCIGDVALKATSSAGTVKFLPPVESLRQIIRLNNLLTQIRIYESPSSIIPYNGDITIRTKLKLPDAIQWTGTRVEITVQHQIIYSGPRFNIIWVTLSNIKKSLNLLALRVDKHCNSSLVSKESGCIPRLQHIA